MSFLLRQSFVYLSALLLASSGMPRTVWAQVSFQSHQITHASDYLGVAHGDFNGDGREDLIVGSSSTQLYLSNGNGTYEAPKTLPSEIGSAYSVVTGDFNHDGKLDIAILTSQIAVYLGNGDGTFQAPKIVSGSAGNTNLTPIALVAADLNRDSKTDLVELLDGQTPSLQPWISKGDGTFSKGQAVTPYNPNSSGFLSGAVMGDFDGDGKADIALLYSFEGPTTVQIWYGDGAGHLGSPYLIGDPNGYDDLRFVVADVNNDGRSDLIATPFIYTIDDSKFVPQLAVFTGNANRTMKYSTISTAECPNSVAVADLNGDGLNDLTYWENPCSSSGGSTTLVVKPGKGGGTFGAEQTIAQSVYWAFYVDTVRSSTGTKPDLLATEYTAAYNPSGPTPSALLLLTNNSTGGFPGCGVAGVAEGIRLCTPGTTANSPVRFSIGAAGPTPMRAVNVWVDGKKVAEQLTHAFSNYSFLDASVPLAAGSHAVAVYGTGLDGSLQKKTFTLQVTGGSACSSPASAGIHICSPVSGSTVSSPVAVSAAGTVTGTFARFEVWVDGTKNFTSTTTDGASLSLSLGAGKHTFSFYAVNTAGAKWNQVSVVTVR